VSTLRFSANLGFLWPDRPLPDRIHAATAAGFHAVECHWPFDTDPATLREALNATGLSMLALNTPAGNMAAGEFGLAAVPGRESAAREGICRAVDYACAVGANNIHVMAGICEDSRAAMHQMYDNLAWAAAVAEAADVGILIEPINRIDRPGYALQRVSQALDLIHRLEKQEEISNVRLMFDCYHVQMTEGNLLARLQEALPLVGHIQVAGVPGRHEPADCEINYDWLFRHIAALGYQGWIGAEYLPRNDTDTGLQWYEKWKPHGQPAPNTPPVIYRHFHRAALDAEYDNRNKVSSYEDWLERYIQRSAETRDSLPGKADIAYGPSEAETLDILYSGKQGRHGDGLPVHVFFHGGYWRALSKDEFSFVANATRGEDVLCVVVNYALIPDINMDELVAQCRRALIWLWHHVADHGGDPERITVSGHSAGGHLVGMMAATDWPALDAGCPPDLVKHGLSISGLMDLEPIRLCYLNDALGLDRDMARRNSPASLDNTSGSELQCVFGDAEGEEYHRQSATLAARWPHTIRETLPGHDHFSIVMELDNPDSELSRRLRNLMVPAR
jgi:hydroxypyruvate isomerase